MVFSLCNCFARYDRSQLQPAKLVYRRAQQEPESRLDIGRLGFEPRALLLCFLDYDGAIRDEGCNHANRCELRNDQSTKRRTNGRDMRPIDRLGFRLAGSEDVV
jgi:hypothetical protein